MSRSFDEQIDVLRETERDNRSSDLRRVGAIGRLLRAGEFAARGYKSAADAVRDLLNIHRDDAGRYVSAAENLCERITLDGTVLPPRLPATAEVFRTGAISMRHVDTITKILGSGAAKRLSPEKWDGAEVQLAEHAVVFHPQELHTFGTRLIRMLDQDGPEPKDDEPEVNELTVTRHPDRPGGTIRGRFDNAVMFDRIATVVDALSKPLTSDDQRSSKERQAEALADVCGQVLDHGDVPQCGGRRPQVNVIATLTELEDRARTAVLDFGGYVSARDLRMLCCDAAVIPIIMNSDSEPLDIGRTNRTIPSGIRRAVAARDRGCARCGRPASWSEVHHIVEWQNGGPTEITNLVMLCRVHHREIHATEWVVRIVNGLPEFIPPRWIDPNATYFRLRV